MIIRVGLDSIGPLARLGPVELLMPIGVNSQSFFASQAGVTGFRALYKKLLLAAKFLPVGG